MSSATTEYAPRNGYPAMGAGLVENLPRPVSCDTDEAERHADALASTQTKTAAIHYAVRELGGGPTGKVMAWLESFGYTTSRSMVSQAVSAYKAERGLTDDVDDESASPPEARAGEALPDSGSDAGVLPSAENTVASEYEASPTVEAPQREERAPWVAVACYAVSVVSLAVSLNTSWRFFDRVLHIPTAYAERYVMFAVAELALVVCGAGMAVNVHRDGRPGSFRVIVWAMCAAMAYMAWAESAAEEAVGRILLGPVLGTVMLHLGLGLEMRARHESAGTFARIGRELRERCLSRLGLADDGRDAAQRTRDRKAYAAAALSQPRRWPWSRQAKLERALLAAGVADDKAMRDKMLARLAVVRHAHELSTLGQSSPWRN